MQVLVVVVFVLLVGIAAYYAYYRRQKRRAEFAAFAKQYSLQYSPADPLGLIDYAFTLFSRGDGRGVENVLWGEWQGVSVKAGDYWYYTESTDANGHTSRSYHRYSFAIADVALGLPPISVTREGFMTRLADHLGFHDIDFESEAFNRAFNIQCKDREFAFKIIDARMMQFMLTTEGFGFEAVGPWALVYRSRCGPTELVPVFGTAKGFHDHIPRLVWNEYGIAADRKETTA